MRLATWNVNSVRARSTHLEAWLRNSMPEIDVVCLQELKVQDDAFPHELIEKLGYTAVTHGQKTYNGVAIISRLPIENLTRGLGSGDPIAEQSRLIGADIGGMRIFSAYFPNGSTVGSEKYAEKLAWMKHLRGYLDERFEPTHAIALCGDFNVAPFDDDITSPKEWRNSVLANDEVRSALTHVQSFGLVDAVRPFFPDGGPLTWWDYRSRGLERNDGLRIDHIYVTKPVADRVIGAVCDKAERRRESPSDHAPVIIELRP